MNNQNTINKENISEKENSMFKKLESFLDFEEESLIPDNRRALSQALKNKDIDYAFFHNMTTEELVVFVNGLSEQDLK